MVMTEAGCVDVQAVEALGAGRLDMHVEIDAKPVLAEDVLRGDSPTWTGMAI